MGRYTKLITEIYIRRISNNSNYSYNDLYEMYKFWNADMRRRLSNNTIEEAYRSVYVYPIISYSEGAEGTENEYKWDKDVVFNADIQEYIKPSDHVDENIYFIVRKMDIRGTIETVVIGKLYIKEKGANIVYPLNMNDIKICKKMKLKYKIYEGQDCSDREDSEGN